MFIIFCNTQSSTTVIIQLSGLLEKIYLHNKKPYTFVPYLKLIAAIIIKGRF